MLHNPERRKSQRRQLDVEKEDRILHCAKRLVKAEELFKGKLTPTQRRQLTQLFSAEVDELLAAIGVTREQLQ